MKRNISNAWALVVQVTERPHGGRFETLTRQAEAAFDAAAQRLRLVDHCLGLLETHDDAAVAGYEVTPGGLTYPDAALQCLLGGCVESLEAVSDKAALEARFEHALGTIGGRVARWRE